MGNTRPPKINDQAVLEAVQDLTKGSGHTTAPALARVLGVYKVTARSYLQRLKRLGVVRPEGRCKHQRWVWCAEEARF